MRRLALVALIALAACGGSDSSTAPTPINVVGAFQLKTVNGSALPYGTTSGAARVEITAEQISLNADGTYSDVASVRITQGATVVTSQVANIGVYRATNGAVQFTQTSPSAGSFNGTVNGSALTILISSATWVYGR